MPDVDTDRVIAFLKERWAGRNCPMCGKGNWSVQDSLFELREYQSGAMVVGGPIIPILPVVCTNCGNTQIVSALMTGAIEKPREQNNG